MGGENLCDISKNKINMKGNFYEENIKKPYNRKLYFRIYGGYKRCIFCDFGSVYDEYGR